MMYRVTQRCALITIYREVGLDKNMLAECCSEGLVCVSNLHVYVRPVDC